MLFLCVSDHVRGYGLWLYDPATNANHTATCLAQTYNIEVRPCTDPTRPVRIRLSSERVGGRRVIHSNRAQLEAPFVLFGPFATKGDVLPSPKPPQAPPGVAASSSPRTARAPRRGRRGA
jgi:hypothetical protein